MPEPIKIHPLDLMTLVDNYFDTYEIRPITKDAVDETSEIEIGGKKYIQDVDTPRVASKGRFFPLAVDRFYTGI